jgi:histidinol-phosphate phosphatase family protein
VKAVIVAGGEGERIRSIARTTPKPLLDIGGRPVVEHQVRLLRHYGITDIHLTIRKRDEAAFRARLGNGGRFDTRLRYYVEPQPMHTAGAIASIINRLGKNFLVLYGDVMIHMDLKALLDFHRAERPGATLAVHPTDHPDDSDLVDLADDGRVRTLRPKPRPPEVYCRNFGNAGAYVVSHRIAEYFRPKACDFMRDVFPAALCGGATLYAYNTREYLKDIGTPERLRAVRADWASGRVAHLHRDNALPAIFFDRDGTLCDVVPLLHDSTGVRLLPGAVEAVRRTNEAGWLAVVITNQPVIAHGLCSVDELERIHGRLESLLCRKGAKLDAVYYCPHHPDSGYEGEVAELKTDCDCRKPGGAMVERAVRDLNIDLARSVFVGDSTADVETGRRLGIRTVLVETGNAGRDGKFDTQPDTRCADAAEAVRTVLK